VQPAIGRLLHGLDADQAAAVTSSAPTLCVLAGAGSGKTRVLTRRVARRVLDGSAQAQHALVLTFTRKAAAELSSRLRSLGVEDDVTTGTFHAVAFAELRRRWLDQGRSAPVIAPNPARLLDRALEGLRLNRSLNARSVATEIAWAKSHRLGPDGYENGVRALRHRPPIAASQVAKVFDAYEAEKRRRRVIDYDDLLLLLTEAIANDRKFAAAQQWRFRHFFVDEFQDLNKAQFDLLRAWIGDREDVFVVGDPNQAIYGWNGADASFLAEIDRHFPNVQTVCLTTNYRSAGPVLAAANAVLPAADARGPEVPLDDAPDGIIPVVRRFTDEKEEADAVARLVRDAHRRSYRWSDLAVLVRTNAQRSALERAFEALDLPYRSSGGAAWLYRPEVRAALDYLRQAGAFPLAQRAADVEQMALDAGDAARVHLDELAAAVRQCLASEPGMTVSEFLAWVEVASRNDGPGAGAGSGTVTITTFHRAKGLEWPVVFLCGIEEGYVPMGKAGSDQARIDEERRLFYVAVTRARSELHCSWAGQRLVGDDVVLRAPSPWLEAIADVSPLSVASPSSPGGARRAIEDGKALLGADVDVREPGALDDDRIRAALLGWRGARARLTGAQAHHILDDGVLDRICTQPPACLDELVQRCGMGPVQAAAIGEQILSLVRAVDGPVGARP